MTHHKVRRNGSVTIAVPILLIGSDCEGRVFSEEIKTVIISLPDTRSVQTPISEKRNLADSPEVRLWKITAGFYQY
jgi:hypothetical protein